MVCIHGRSAACAFSHRVPQWACFFCAGSGMGDEWTAAAGSCRNLGRTVAQSARLDAIGYAIGRRRIAALVWVWCCLTSDGVRVFMVGELMPAFCVRDSSTRPRGPLGERRTADARGQRTSQLLSGQFLMHRWQSGSVHAQRISCALFGYLGPVTPGSLAVILGFRASARRPRLSR